MFGGASFGAQSKSLQRVWRRAALVAGRCRSDRGKGRRSRAADGGACVAARRDEPHPGSPARRAVDLDATAKQREPLTDAEQSPTNLAGLRSIVEFSRFEPDSLIRNGDAQLVFGVERQVERDPIRTGVLDRVGEELSDR